MSGHYGPRGWVPGTPGRLEFVNPVRGWSAHTSGHHTNPSERIAERHRDCVAFFRCRCVWDGEQCPNNATQEDGLCDWCGTRTDEQLRTNPKALIDPDGEFQGIGGAGERHVNASRHPDACWMPVSGRTLVEVPHG